MIWHIFRKDWKLLRWQTLALIALGALAMLTDASRGFFVPVEAQASQLTVTLIMAGYAGCLLLIFLLVQHEGPPGDGMDWLVRPVRRSDLLFAKLLFIVLVLHGAQMALETAMSLAMGLPAGASLAQAAQDSLETFLEFTLPVFAFACLVRNLVEGMAVVLFSILFRMVLGYAITGQANFPLPSQTAGSGEVWIAGLAGDFLYVAGALLVLAIQYGRRRTGLARGIAFVVFVFGTLTPLLPWQTAFAVQRHFARQEGAASGIKISFSPGSSAANHVHSAQDSTVYVPLHVEGLPQDTWIYVDRWDYRITNSSGTQKFEHVSGSDFQQSGLLSNLQPDESDSGKQDHYQAITIGDSKSQPADLYMNYSLTLMKLVHSDSIPAVDGDRRMGGAGQCRTRIGRAGAGVEIGCIYQGAEPRCVTAILERRSDGQRNTPARTCYPDYTPWQSNALGRWGNDLFLPILDDNKRATLPVNPSNVRDSRLLLRIYQPVDHFTREVTIPGIQLGDWLPK